MAEINLIKKKTKAGLQWNLIGQVASYLITLIGTIILSRLLSPSEFGLFGMLAVLSSLGSLVVGMGLAHAIVQNQQLTEQDLSSIFWLNFIFGTLMALTFYFSAETIAIFYNQPELEVITQSFSVIFLIYGFSSVPLGILSKGLKFKELVLSQLVASIISYTISVFLASAGYGVCSLVCQSLINHGVYNLLNFYFCKWRPQFLFSRDPLMKISKFSRNFLPSQLLDFFSQSFDMLLIGKYIGKADLGLYGRAAALVQLPVNSLGLIFNKTFFSMFSALQEKQEALVDNYYRAIKYLSLSLIPILILTSILANDIVIFLFGNSWSMMAPLTSWLAISGILTSYNNFNDSVITSQGRTDLLLRINFVEKVLLIISIYIGLNYGIIGIVYARIFSVLLMFIPKLLILAHVLKTSIKLWFYNQRLIFISLGLTAGLTYALSSAIQVNPFVNLASIVFFAFISMFGLLMLLREKSILDLLQMIKVVLRAGDKI